MEAPPVIVIPRKKIAVWPLLVMAAMAVSVMVLYRFDPAQNSFYPRCTFYATTGLLCPGCGSQRALHHLVHGDILTAMRCNAFMVGALPFALFHGSRCMLRWLKGEPLPRFAPSSRAMIIFGMALGLYGILRNIPVSPFIHLAPP